jgi:uncharacterized protein YciI
MLWLRGKKIMGQYIYKLQVTRPSMLTEGPTVDEERALTAHASYLNEQLAAGRVILFGRTQTTDEDTFGIVIFEAEDEHAAAQFMRADPAISAAVMEAQLWPYAISGMRASE